MMLVMIMLVMMVVVYDGDGDDDADYSMVVTITTIINTLSSFVRFRFFYLNFKSMYLGKIDDASCVG